ncbi:YaaA family protein [Vulcanisaeta thermophila]|uniref:YaaA family protein n=1 Tax=Vulcanisaeta thermophila TaxID=867917 RepID=UPI001EE354AB|nr:YaaA family protein [Vulcanisaeta thermophila]
MLNCSMRKRYEEEVRKLLGGLPGFDLENEGRYRELLRDFVKPAIEIYDGPEFRILRKYHDYIINGLIDVYVLSARYGIIKGTSEIIPYNAYLGSVKDPSEVINKWFRYGNWGLNELKQGGWDYGIIRLSRVYARYFINLVPNPCSLAKSLYLLLSGKSANYLSCQNGIHVPIRGVGSSQHYLEKILKEVLIASGISASHGKNTLAKIS